MAHVSALIPASPPPPGVRKAVTRSAVVGFVALLVWGMVFVGLVMIMVNGWDTDKFVRYGPKYISGLGITLTLVAISIVCGAILSLPLAFARMSKNRIISGLAYLYVYVFRGTPLLAQLYLIYYGLGSFGKGLESVGLWWFFRDAFNCALLSFTMNTAAYQAEILRGAIESVPRGQWEGASALGLTRRQAFIKIIMPQALIVALRPYGNEIILMIKGSAIVAIVTVFDLMGETRRAFSRTYDYQTYLWAAIFYLVMVEILRNTWAKLEAILTRHLKR